MNKRAYLYIAALLGITSPFYAAPASAAQTYSKTAMQQGKFSIEVQKNEGFQAL